MVVEERYRPIVSFRVNQEEWEQLRSGSAKAGNDESVGAFSKRLALKEAGRSHKKNHQGNGTPEAANAHPGESGEEGEG